MIVTELIKKVCKGKRKLKEVFRQYGGVLIAAAATSAFLVLMGNIVLAQGGMLAQLINIWGNSAI